MKRVSIAALLCAVLLLFAACLPNRTAETDATPEPTATPKPSPSPSPVPTPEPTATPSPTPSPTPTEIPVSDPVVTLIGGETLTLTARFTFEDPGFTAADYLGNDLTDRVTAEGEVIPYLVGSYERTYTVTDDFDRTTVAVRTVTIVPVELPEVVMPPEKTVYLTFDDGPSGYTDDLLDTLKKYNAKATFFIVGERGREELIARAYREGHSIGVHTYSHEYLEIYASEQAFFDDFLKTQEIIKRATGSYTQIFRFPGGSGNRASGNKGIMTRLTKIMEDLGYRYFDWTVSSGDATTEPTTTETFAARIIGGIRKHSDYAVILQHDLKYRSVCAVEAVLDWGTRNGYTFLPLDMTSPVVHSKVQN